MPGRTKTLLVLGASSLLAAAILTGAGAEAAAAPAWQFDLGTTTSQVAAGFTRVANTTLYDAGTGFGLDKAISSRDRGTPDDLRRDFVVGSDYGFAVDVPNGDYRVRVVSGDQIASNHTLLSFEDGAALDLTTAAGEFADQSVSVTVTDGQLNVHATGDGRINAIAIAQTASPTHVHAAAVALRPTPSVTLEWDAVDAATGYSVYRRGPDDADFVRVGTADATTYVDDAVLLGTGYTYAVAALAEGGVESELSPSVPVAVTDDAVTPPVRPTGLQLRTSAKKDTFTLSWSRVPHAVAYYVYRAEGESGTFSMIDRTRSPDYELYIAPSTPCCYDLRFRVVAVNDGGLSAPSEGLPVVRSEGTG